MLNLKVLRQIYFAEIHSPSIPEKLVENVYCREFGGEVHQHKIHMRYLLLVDSGLVLLEMVRKVRGSET